MELQKIVEEAVSVSYTNVYPIEDFTIQDLVELSSLAKKAKVELRIRKETSNFYQGTLLEVQRYENRVNSCMEEITYET